jgi:hypothetical protein
MKFGGLKKDSRKQWLGKLDKLELGLEVLQPKTRLAIYFVDRVELSILSETIES